MIFANLYILHLMWMVLLLLAVTAYGIGKRSRILRKYIDFSMVPVMTSGYSVQRRWLKGMLLVAVLFLSVISLAGPQAGFRWEKVEAKGVDIMIALDCSRSMLASDIKPSRLEQAKREILDLLNMMDSDRVGLVAFSGAAILQCPLTLDYSAFHIFLDALSPEYLPMGGTDIRGAIETAVNGFEKDADSEKAIILITDGENTSDDPLEAVKDAAKLGIRIFCIGVGREEGAPIPDSSGGFKKDRDGRIVMSKVDDKMLGQIASMGMGRYVKSVAGDMDLDVIYTREISGSMEKTTLESGKKKVWENRFQWFLLPAVLLLIFELFISDHRKMDINSFRHENGQNDNNSVPPNKISSVSPKNSNSISPKNNNSISSKNNNSISSKNNNSISPKNNNSVSPKNNNSFSPKNNNILSQKNTFLKLLTFIITTVFISILLFDLSDLYAGTYSSVKKGIEAFNSSSYEDARKNFIDAQLQSPDMPELYYNIGSAAYKLEDYESALSNFTRAMDTEDPLLRDKSTFNLGNTKYRMGDLEGAVETFEKIGKDSPLYQKAAENIEFVKKKIEEKKQEEENKQKGDQQQDGQDQDEQKGDKQQIGQNQDEQKGDKQQDGQDQDEQKGDNQQDGQDQDEQKGDKQQIGQDQDEQKGDNQQDGQDQDEQNGDNQQSGQDQEEQNGDKQQIGQNQDEKNGYEQQSGQNQGSQKHDNSGESAYGNDGNEEPSSDFQKQAHERLLNRLEDKPGSAMIPSYSGQDVEKDW
ncbi:membrane hypothetical protein [Desulfamplus magnetovallimortis]|uniref:VWFA domain-containing protein n=1 Tax=Desulfamplus magnetovallimortis TaxID=1246637 RepID=A0A1W1HDG9_9BACT|nr:VWA domain-containing protein [Desulfamplus magnetovallimortis]SLM30537.1 membrane hypothetical protein [Desulfamplus magnetovallimortis]